MTDPNRDDRDEAAADPAIDPDEAELIAYLDGELDASTARRVEAKLATDRALRAKATALKKSFDLLDYLPRAEPSGNFTTRTMDRLPVLKGATTPPPMLASTTPTTPTTTAPSTSSTSAPLLTGSGVQPQAVSSSVQWLVWALGIVLAGSSFAAAGYFGTQVARPLLFPAPKEADDDVLLSDHRTIEHLPLYAAVDDFEYLTWLADPDLFGDDPTFTSDGPKPPASAATGYKIPEKAFDALARTFSRMTAERQAQLRQLDITLHEKDAATQSRLFRVLESYAVWLDRLPDGERRGVFSAGTPRLRLALVRELRERQWLDGLPSGLRKQLDPLPADQRGVLVAKWKDEENLRRDNWSFARQHWDTFQSNRVPWPFEDEKARKDVIDFMRLAYRIPDEKRPRFAHEELARYKELLDRAEKVNEWAWYGKTVYELHRKYELLPEPASGPPITTISELGLVGQRYFGKGKGGQTVIQSVGKWPDFALAVHGYLVSEKITPATPLNLGPCRPADFKEPLRTFLEKELFPKLKPAEQATLEQLEGKWPDYPRALAKAAKFHDVALPGVMLPGRPSLWEKTYTLPRGSKRPG